ncbi:gamma-aminobutyric acid type B receptor subunit 2-like isoform X2 [Corticium candelabrum]|uniref:gamma-aminobutyric acid type B receptor subunit 2-like isoform X2 n=1 Tax=Corticium candelabrum TaxID=121492 RepID=UPI002E25C297|nr:gamma-aminobutyric acid type B receptor subunit 2-like isoform X2 [Corticium candelabrum]
MSYILDMSKQVHCSSEEVKMKWLDHTIHQTSDKKNEDAMTHCDRTTGNVEMLKMFEQKKKVVALIAAGCSTVTEPLAESSHYWNLLQFNFLSTSPSLQECDKLPNLYTLQPSEYGLVPARVALLKTFKWTKAVIFHQPIDLWSLTAEKLHEAFVEANFTSEMLSVSGDADIVPAVQHAVKTKIRIWIILSYENVAKKLICQASKHGIRSTTYTWVYVGGICEPEWYLKQHNESGCSKRELREAFDGHFSVDYAHYGADNESLVLPTDKTVLEVANEIRNYPAQSPGISCRKNNIRYVFEGHLGFGYDAVVATALLLKEYMRYNSNIPLEDFTYKDSNVITKLNEIVMDSSFQFDGITGKIKFFDRKCQSNSSWGRVIARYNINNNWSFVWEYNNDNDSDTGHLLDEPEWPGGKQPTDFPEQRFVSSIAFGVVTFFVCIGVILTFGCFVYGLLNRNMRIFRLSGPRLNAVVAIGCLLGYMSVLLDGLNGQFFALQLWSCYVKVFLYAVAFSCMFGVVLVQMWRVSLGIKQNDVKQNRTKRRPSTFAVDLTENKLLVFIGIFLVIDVVLVIIWFSVDPWTTGTRPLESGDIYQFEQDKCVCNNFWVWTYVFSGYKGLLLTFGIYLAFDIRQIKVALLSDSRFMAFAVYTTVVFCIMLFAFLHVEVTDPDVYYALTSFMMLIIISVLLLLLYVPKIYVLKFHPDKFVGGIGPARAVEKGSMSDHTIASTHHINLLRRRSAHQLEIITTLIEERNITDATIERVTDLVDLHSNIETVGSDRLESTSSTARVLSDDSGTPSNTKKAATGIKSDSNPSSDEKSRSNDKA